MFDLWIEYQSASESWILEVELPDEKNLIRFSGRGHQLGNHLGFRGSTTETVTVKVTNSVVLTAR
jgi:hypothetical protein